MHDYYYRDENEAGEVVIQAANTELSVRVTEVDGQTTALINLPVEEIDRMIEGLQVAKRKMLASGARR